MNKRTRVILLATTAVHFSWGLGFCVMFLAKEVHATIVILTTAAALGTICFTLGAIHAAAEFNSNDDDSVSDSSFR